MENILIAGGTGMIGKALSAFLLREGYEVIVLTRQQNHPSQGTAQLSYASWDPSKGFIEEKAIMRADHIINLAGAGVADKRWTEKRKKEIAESRILAGRAITGSLQKIPNKVRTVVQASAIGWYGPDPVPMLDPFAEHLPSDPSFLGATCKQWEESIAAVEGMQKRLVTLRIGIVLSRSGGALKEFLRPLQMGVAPILGKGDQMISWIHIEDLCRMIQFSLKNERMKGVFNAVSPHPVSNAAFMRTLAALRNGFWHIAVPVPAFILKIMMGEMSIEVLKSATVSGAKIQSAGFDFSFPTLKEALRDLLNR